MTHPSQPFPKEAIETIQHAAKKAWSDHYVMYGNFALPIAIDAALAAAAPFFAAERDAAIEAEREARNALMMLLDVTVGLSSKPNEHPMIVRARSVVAKSEEAKS